MQIWPDTVQKDFFGEACMAKSVCLLRESSAECLKRPAFMNEIETAWCAAMSLIALSTSICFRVWAASTCRWPDSTLLVPGQTCRLLFLLSFCALPV